MDIIFIRHGKTEMNRKKLFAGAIDCSLSNEGMEEARAAKKAIGDIKFDKVYISPMKRTAQTAEIMDVCWKTDDRIKEMNFGIFEGLSYDKALSSYENEMKCWEDDFINYRIPQGESLMDVYLRVCDFMDSIADEKGRILVITHKGVINCALSSIFGGPEHYYRFSADNCRFTQISMEEGYKYIKTFNSMKIY